MHVNAHAHNTQHTIRTHTHTHARTHTQIYTHKHTTHTHTHTHACMRTRTQIYTCTSAGKYENTTDTTVDSYLKIYGEHATSQVPPTCGSRRPSYLKTTALPTGTSHGQMMEGLPPFLLFFGLSCMQGAGGPARSILISYSSFSFSDSPGCSLFLLQNHEAKPGARAIYHAEENP